MVICFNKMFARFLRKADVNERNINVAIGEVIKGNCISLGHKLYKKRIASPQRGKRGAYRSILYYRSGELMIFVYLFAKNERPNITTKEMNELVGLARLYDTLDTKAVEKAVREHKLTRWHYEAQ